MGTPFHLGDHFASIVDMTVRWQQGVYYLPFTCHSRSH